MTLSHRRSPPSLLFVILIIIISLSSLSIQSAHSKSDTSSSSSLEWQILTKHNFSSQIRLNPYLIVIVTLPWSGESRSLMKELAVVTRKKEEFRTLKLMVVHKNLDKMLADGLGATGDINVICYRHSLPYKYQGALRVQNILSSVRYLMSLLPEEIPLKSLSTAEDLTTFLESTDKALLILEFCGWTPKLTAKFMNNGSKNAFGVPRGKGLFGESDEISSAVGKKNKVDGSFCFHLVNEIKRNANKYAVLEQYDENEIEEINEIRAREIVDGFISLKRLPTDEEKSKWTYDMTTYFKQRWDLLVEKGKNKEFSGMQMNDVEVNVYEEQSGIASMMKENDVSSKDGSILSHV